jgi:hypothetical protein
MEARARNIYFPETMILYSISRKKRRKMRKKHPSMLVIAAVLVLSMIFVQIRADDPPTDPPEIELPPYKPPSLPAEEPNTTLPKTRYPNLDKDENNISDVFDAEIALAIAEGRGSEFVEILVQTSNAPTDSDVTVLEAKGGRLLSGRMRTHGSVLGFAAMLSYNNISEYVSNNENIVFIEKNCHDVENDSAYSAQQTGARSDVWNDYSC